MGVPASEMAHGTFDLPKRDLGGTLGKKHTGTARESMEMRGEEVASHKKVHEEGLEMAPEGCTKNGWQSMEKAHGEGLGTGREGHMPNGKEKQPWGSAHSEPGCRRQKAL